ncbi:hypothetical protein Tco_1570605 [Tanacetum coccineum]
MGKQSTDSSLEKLWYLADEDDEEENYVFDMNEFLAIQIHNNLSSKSAGTPESLYSTLDEKYDAIACDFSPKLEFLLASESHTVVPVYSLETFKEEYKVESEVFDLLKIDVDLFTFDTPLDMIFDEFCQLSSMEDDLLTYDVEVLKPSYMSCVEQPYNLDIYNSRQCYDEYERMFVEAVILIDNRLVKPIAITLENIYMKQFKEYMEIKRRLEVNGHNTDVECDPTNVELKNWIETYIFDFETPLCKEFKEFNHLIHIDVDVDEKPWLENGIWKEPTDDICHECKPFQFKSGHVEWPTCNWCKDRYCNGGDLPGMIRVGNMVYFQDYEWYEGLEVGDLKEALKENFILEGSWGHENRKGKNFALEEYWWGKKEEEESSEDAWSNNLPNDEWEHCKDTTYTKSDVNYNYDTYNNVCQMFKNHTRINNDNDAIQANQEWFDEHEPMGDDDDDMGDLDDYLIPNDAPYYVDEEEEGSNYLVYLTRNYQCSNLKILRS